MNCEGGLVALQLLLHLALQGIMDVMVLFLLKRKLRFRKLNEHLVQGHTALQRLSRD